MIEVFATPPKENLEKQVDEEIAAFDAWLQKNIDAMPIVNSERAILKTYLGYKLGVAREPAGTTAGVEASDGT